jgi:putative membrane protein
VLTLGVFYLVVNGIAFGLAAALVPGFNVSSLLAAIAGAFVTGVAGWILGMVLVPVATRG